MKGSIRKGIAVDLFGKVRASVLGLLYCHSSRSFYLREIIRQVEAGQGAVQRELGRLVAAGLLTRRKVGNQTHYQAKSNSPIFSELKSLMVKTTGLADVLRIALEPLEPRIKMACVYGSFAKGTETANSDVDVAVVGDVTFEEVSDRLFEAQEQLIREVNPSVYSVTEFVDKLSHGNHFLTRLMHEPKILLIGDDDEFGGLVEGRTARGA